MVVIDNVVLMEDKYMKQLTFTSHGEPPVQQRPKIVYRNWKHPIYYDPSGPAKKEYSFALKSALLGAGIAEFPVFHCNPTTGKGLQLTINFYFKRPRMDYKIIKKVPTIVEHPHLYPTTKDTDNMTKFVMDALHGTNNVIVVINAQKHFVSGYYDKAYTTIQLNTY